MTSTYSYDYINGLLIDAIDNETDDEFWGMIAVHLKNAMSKGWESFDNESFKVYRIEEMRPKFDMEFLKKLVLVLPSIEPERLFEVVVKYSNLFEHKITINRIVDFYLSERSYFVKCINVFYLNNWRVQKRTEIWNLAIKKFREAEIEEVVRALLKSTLVNRSRSASSTANYKSSKTDMSRKKKLEAYESTIAQYKHHLVELGEILDLLFMIVYSYEVKKNIKNVSNWIRELSHPMMGERGNFLKFGYEYLRRFRSRPELIRETYRIIGLCVLNFLQFLYLDDDEFPGKMKQQHLMKIEEYLRKSQSDTAFYGLVLLGWATFLKSKKEFLGKLVDDVAVEKHFENGMKCQGLQYLKILFNREDNRQYPFFGHEQNIEAYKNVTRNFLVCFLSTIDELSSLPSKFILEITQIISCLVTPYSMCKVIRNEFISYFFREYIDYDKRKEEDDDSDDEVRDHTPIMDLLYISKAYFPTRLEFLQFFSSLCFSAHSMTYIFSFLNIMDYFTLDIPVEFFEKLNKQRLGNKEIEDEKSNTMRRKSGKGENETKDDEEYILLQDFVDGWSGVSIRRGTHFTVFERSGNRVTISFANPEYPNIQAGMKTRTVEGWRVFLSLLFKLRQDVIHMEDIDPHYKYLFSIFEKIIKFGSNYVRAFLDHQIYFMRNKNANLDSVPRVIPGLLLLQSICSICKVSLDRAGNVGTKKGRGLLSVISGCWKCLGAFAQKNPDIVVPYVVKFVESFDDIVQLEGFMGVYDCCITILNIIKTICQKHSWKMKGDVFYITNWMAANIFVTHSSWKYQNTSQKFLISLRCIEIFSIIVDTFSVKEQQKMIESLFFEGNGSCSEFLFSIIGYGKGAFKIAHSQHKGDDTFMVEDLLEKAFYLADRLLYYKNEYGFRGNAIDNSLRMLISEKREVPLIQIIFQFTMFKYSTAVRCSACKLIRHIIDLEDPPSVIGSLGSKALMYVGKQLHYLSIDHEEDLFKINLLKLITASIYDRKGFGQMYLNYDPTKYYYYDMEEGKASTYDSKYIFKYSKTKKLIEGGFPQILLHVLKNYEKIDIRLLRACVYALEAIFTSSSKEIRTIIRNDIKFWETIFGIFEQISLKDREEMEDENSRRRKANIEEYEKGRNIILTTKNLLNMITIDLYLGKIMNSFFFKPRFFGKFYHEVSKHPGIFRKLLGKGINDLIERINSSCVILGRLKRRINRFNGLCSNRNERFQLDDYRSEEPNQMYDVDRLRRWKFLINDRSGNEVERKDNEDQKDFSRNLKEKIEIMKSIISYVDEMNIRLKEMRGYMDFISNFAKMFTVFVIPFKDQDMKHVLISFPFITRFLDILILKGLEFTCKKKNVPEIIEKIQSHFHLKCSKMILFVLKAIVQMITIKRLEELRKDYLARLNKMEEKEKEKPKKYVTSDHMKMIFYCLEREIDSENENIELIFNLLTSLLFLVTKIPNDNIDISHQEKSMLMNPIIIKILKKFSEKYTKFVRHKKSLVNTSKLVSSFKVLDFENNNGSQNTYANILSDEEIEELEDLDEEIEEIEDEDEEIYLDPMSIEKRRRRFQCVCIALHLLSIQKYFRKLDIEYVYELLLREEKLKRMNRRYRLNKEYLQILIQNLFSVVTVEIERSRIVMMMKVRVDGLLKMVGKNDKEKIERLKKNQIQCQNEFERDLGVEFFENPSYFFLNENVVELLIRLVYHLNRNFNDIRFKSTMFLNNYKKLLVSKQLRKYIYKNKKRRSDIFKKDNKKNEDSFYNLIINFQKMNLCKKMNSIFYGYKKNEGIGISKLQLKEKRISVNEDNYQCWHQIWTLTLQLMISLLIRYKDKCGEKVKNQVMEIINEHSQRFIYSLILKKKSEKKYFTDDLFYSKYLREEKDILNKEGEEFYVSTKIELEETRLVAFLFDILCEKLSSIENEKFVLAIVESTGHCVELLRRGVESIIFPYTKKERRIYRIWKVKNMSKKSQTVGEKVELNKEERSMDSDDENDSEDSDYGDDEFSFANSILSRSFELIDKQAHFTWDAKLTTIAFDIVHRYLGIIQKLLIIERERKIVILRKPDIASRNFYCLLELMQVCVSMIPVIFGSKKSKKKSQKSGILDQPKVDENEKEGGEIEINVGKTSREEEKNSLQIMKRIEKTLKEAVQTCLMHLDSFKLLYKRTTQYENFEAKMASNLRTTLEYCLNDHLRHYDILKDKFSNKERKVEFIKLMGGLKLFVSTNQILAKKKSSGKSYNYKFAEKEGDDYSLFK